ncbi:hypothetical protein POM88_007441 [Heracleum sosnowskyi]|uniref:Zinc finger GRF-type domain-containing protein n=1 Tax=Heracleum sosnowskyi TaxID=360622 RepID=A0AAD8N7K1_9APIA|nr:hypothetical protein POM88_007441 [Heracleum sosnowskyi]
MAERCLCGNWLVAKTAWTSSNAGRRFMACDRCRYFRWVDGPLCERARLIILGLLRRINNLERQQQEMECRRVGLCPDEGERSMVCSKSASKSTEENKSSEEIKSSSNIPLTLLIVTWIAIFVYIICKTGDVEEM